MKPVWHRLADQLDRIPSRWGVPLMLLAGVVFWIVTLKLMRM
jgi:uncharacterized membrane protein